MTGTGMNLSQSDLDSSRAWKACKNLMEKAEATESVAELEKLQAGADLKYDRLREFFGGNKQLVSDLVGLCGSTISGRIHLYTPRLARLPKPDYEQNVKGGFEGLNRSVRIVEEFRKAHLRDDFIEEIRKDLIQSVSALRNTLIRLEQDRNKRSPKGPISDAQSIDSMKTALNALSDKIDGWEVEHRRSAGQSEAEYLLQSELDTSPVWNRYCELHRKIRMTKSVDSLADVSDLASRQRGDLATLMRDSAFAEILVAWVKLLRDEQTAVLVASKRKRGTADDWARLLSEFALIRTEFEVARFFKDRSLYHSVVGTMTGKLAARSYNLAGNAKSFHANAGNKDAAPGTWKKLTAKQEKAIHEIEAFDKSTQRTLAKWKKTQK